MPYGCGTVIVVIIFCCKNVREKENFQDSKEEHQFDDYQRP